MLCSNKGIGNHPQGLSQTNKQEYYSVSVSYTHLDVYKRQIHPVPPVYVRGQIEAVMEDIRPDAVKIGMINDVEIVEAIASCLRTYRPRFVVFDPVMVRCV